MTIENHLDKFAGYNVKSWQPSQPLADLDTTIYRIAVEYDEEMSWEEKFQQYLAMPNAEQSRGLVLGAYSEEMYDKSAEGPIELVIAAKERLPSLEVLFLNDITYEENEISWIINTDNAPLMHAFPKLKHYGTRGGSDLVFNHLNAPELETLVVQTGGLSATTVKDIIAAILPKLKHLELYLGSENYGCDFGVDELKPILEGHFPHLTYLGLKDSEAQDNIAQTVIKSPIASQLEVLDLSLGTLGDEGAQVILEATSLTQLKHLNLSYHYMSDEMMEKIKAFATQQGFTVDVSDQQKESNYGRYISISE